MSMAFALDRCGACAATVNACRARPTRSAHLTISRHLSSVHSWVSQPVVRPSRGESRHARAAVRVVAAGWNPPTVADTKQKFYQLYTKPIPALYAPAVLEFLVQQHLIRYNKNYVYDEVYALGFVSVFDQVLDGIPDSDRETLFGAYLTALDEDPSRYRADASKIENWASSLSSWQDIKPSAEGDEIQKKLAEIADRVASGNFLYSKFFAIGLFRLLELTGAKDPKALEGLVKSMNVRTDSVNRDLLMYKGVLSKLAAAKELMKEFLARERKKREEREAEQAAKAAAAAKPETTTVDVSA